MEGDDESCGRIVSRVFEIMLFLFLPCCVGLMLTADDLMVVMFGESFAPAGETLRIVQQFIWDTGAFNIWRGKKASFLYDRWGSVKCLS